MKPKKKTDKFKVKNKLKESSAPAPLLLRSGYKPSLEQVHLHIYAALLVDAQLPIDYGHYLKVSEEAAIYILSYWETK